MRILGWYKGAKLCLLCGHGMGVFLECTVVSVLHLVVSGSVSHSTGKDARIDHRLLIVFKEAVCCKESRISFAHLWGLIALKKVFVYKGR
eukprot:2274715-Amphidinium_carterae.1